MLEVFDRHETLERRPEDVRWLTLSSLSAWWRSALGTHVTTC